MLLTGRRFVWPILVVALLSARAASGLAGEVEEYQVKGAFLYNFLKYVDWSQDHLVTGDEFVIAIYGSDPFGSDLDEALADRRINARSVRVIRIPSGDSIPDCHLLFTKLDEEEDLRPLLDRSRSRHILTVGESNSFLRNGGMIRLVVDDNRVRFDVNLQITKAAQLSISSKLLNLARTVIRED